MVPFFLYFFHTSLLLLGLVGEKGFVKIYISMSEHFLLVKAKVLSLRPTYLFTTKICCNIVLRAEMHLHFGLVVTQQDLDVPCIYSLHLTAFAFSINLADLRSPLFDVRGTTNSPQRLHCLVIGIFDLVVGWIVLPQGQHTPPLGCLL